MSSSPAAALSTRTWETTTLLAVALPLIAASFLAPVLKSQTGESIVVDRTGRDGRGLGVLPKTAGSARQMKPIPVTGTEADLYSGHSSVSFADTAHGWVLLQLSSSSIFSRGTLYATGDGGGSWVRLAPPPCAGQILFRSANDGWLAGGAGGDELYRTRDGGWSWARVALPPAPDSGDGRTYWPAVDLPRFGTGMDGTLGVTYTSSAGSLLTSYRTSDGGASWQLEQVQPLSGQLGPGVFQAIGSPAAPSDSAATGVVAGADAGVDSCYAPAISSLQAWREASAYHSVTIYLGGTPRGCQAWNRDTITASWVQQATSMGWHLILAWAGSGIEADPAAASRQGMSEAAAAADAAAAIGLPSDSILYVEVAAPPDADASPSAEVRAYVGGWVLRLHAAGYGAGVRGDSYAADAWAGLENTPDGVWTAAPQDGSACGPIPAGARKMGQRVQQCTAPHTESYGGVALNVGTHRAGPLDATVTMNTYSISPSTLTSGQMAYLFISLTGAAPAGGASVLIGSSNTTAFPTQNPYLIPAGQTSAMFTVQTGPVTALAAVTSDAGYGGVVKLATVTVMPAATAVALTSVSINPSTVTAGGTATVTFHLSGPAPAGGPTITVYGNDPSWPGTTYLTVGAGQTSASMQAQIGAVAAATKVLVFGVYNGVTLSGSLTVNPSAPVSLTAFSVSPATVGSGGTVTMTATLSGPAPYGGASIGISASDPSFQVLPAYVVPAAQTAATFSIGIGTVTATTAVTVGASYNGTSRTATVTVTPSTPTPSAPRLSSINISPSTVASGQTAAVSVMLTGAAPTGGASIGLTSSNLTAFPVPSSCLIPAGHTGASCSVTAGPVTASATLSVGASYSGVTQNAGVVVTPAAVTFTSLSISPSTVTAGATATVTLTLSGPAPTGGASFQVTSRDTGSFPMPASYVIPAGQTTGTISVQAGPVTASTTVQVQAAYGATVQSATVTVAPPAVTLTSLNISPSSVAPGGTASVIMTLSGPAPAGGASVSMGSNNQTVLPLPSTYLIPAGQRSASFDVQAGTVTAATQVTITAGYGGGTPQYASVTVTPTPSTVTMSSYAISPATVTAGGAVTLAFTLTGAAPVGGAQVLVGSGNLTALPVQSPYTIPAGQTTASFTVTTGPVSASTTVTSDAGCGGVVKLATVTVTPAASAAVKLSSMSISPLTVASSGTAVVTLTLSAPAPAGGASVSLYSNSAAFPVPASYTIPAGQTSANLNVQAGTVTVSTPVSIAAGYGGGSQYAAVTVTPPASTVTMSSYTISPSAVTSGGTVTLTLTLTGAAPAGGAQVLVGSGNLTALPVQSPYTIPAGQTTASFSVTTGPVSASTTVTSDAGCGGVVKLATLTVTPAASAVTLSSLSVSPLTVASGGTAAVTLTLSASAPAGGASVSLSSNGTAFPVPASYTIPAGQTSGTISVQAGTVTASTAVSVQAAYGGTVLSASVTVTPVPAVLLNALSISPSTVTSGGTATVTLALSGAAPAGGAPVSLYSNSAAFPVPAGFTVPAGQAGASFTVQAGTVTSPTTVSVAAGYGGGSQYSTVTVAPAASTVAISSYAISPATVTSGGIATLSILLTGPAPAGGAAVLVGSGNLTVFPVQSPYLIPAGQTGASFIIQTGPVLTATTITSDAGFGGVVKLATVTVTPAASAVTLAAVRISPATVTSGGTAAVTLTLSGPAPAGGATVAVSSHDMATFPAPSSYMIPAGQTSASFSVQAGTVSTSTTVSVGAGFGGVSQAATVTVTPSATAATLSSIAIDPATMTSGGMATLTLTLSGAAPASGVSVSVASNNPVALAVQSAYVIPAGQTSASFPVQAGTLSTAATVSVTAGCGGVPQYTTVLVTPPASTVTLSSITISPAMVASGGTATATLTLSGMAPKGGALVTVTSRDPNTFPAPATYVVPAGQSSVSFSVKAGAVSATTPVTVGAAYAGTTMVGTVTVTPTASAVSLSSIGVSPSTVASGATASLTLTLNGPAPAGGAAVSVLCGNAAAFPAQSSYLIPSGQTSASFDVTGGTVASATPVSIGAGYGGVTRYTTVTVTPSATWAALASVNISPATIMPGSTATVTLTLTGPAPAGGAAVVVASHNTDVFPAPGSYLIREGQTSASFSVQAGTATTPTVVTVGAGYGGTSQVATVTVTPVSAAVTLRSVGVSPAELNSGGTATLTLTLNGPAPAGGAAVSVSDADGTAFPALGVYTIPAGQTSASFPVVAGTVSTPEAVTVGAGYGGANGSVVVTVDPPRAVPTRRR